MKWTIQDMGARADYPDWHQYNVRDEKTNVHIASVGHVDRYFEKDTGKHAALITAAPELLEAAKIGLACCIAWGGKCEAAGESILATESVRQAEAIRAAIAKAQEAA